MYYCRAGFSLGCSFHTEVRMPKHLNIKITEKLTIRITVNLMIGLMLTAGF